jgi:tetratricopeptide (TPR) repeat protein
VISRLREYRRDRLIQQIVATWHEDPDGRVLRRLEAAAHRKPKDPQLQMLLASGLAAVDDERSATAARAAVALAPEDPAIAIRAAALFFNIDRYEESRAHLVRSEELAPLGFLFHADQLHLAGRFAARDGDTRRATQLLMASFELEPAAHLHGTVLVSHLCETGDLVIAREIVEKALRHIPGDEELTDYRAWFERGAPTTIWAGSVRFQDTDPPVFGDPDTSVEWWAVYLAHSEDEFREKIDRRLSGLSVTLDALEEVTSFTSPDDADVPRDLAEDIQNTGRNDVTFIPRDRR